MIDDAIDAIRNDLRKSNNTELGMRKNNEYLQELWERRQELLQRMNEAKIESIGLIEKEFLEELNEIDKDYGTIIGLTI